MSGLNLLIEMPELATGISEEELTLDPDGDAKDVGEEQSAVKRDALKIVMKNEAAPGSEEAQFRAQPESEREKDQSGNEYSVGEHWVPSAAMAKRQFQKKSGEALASP
ncbi:hypothetical protein RBB79_17255 [Tunturiibacter empetritectus]|uniref:Uncharacterized protein n=1 Tax=Tunturiibacter lichenicola TaxID=2051959 RepID=A0A852VLT2_9BACT|nr:hypothetical protein [Edaphobacter lichenicola]NYF91374.1 hypothetical protein [Edaphobacter lichenicola]